MSTTSVVALTFRAFDLVGYYELGADLQAALVAASPAWDRFGCGCHRLQHVGEQLDLDRRLGLRGYLGRLRVLSAFGSPRVNDSCQLLVTHWPPAIASWQANGFADLDTRCETGRVVGGRVCGRDGHHVWIRAANIGAQVAADGAGDGVSYW